LVASQEVPRFCDDGPSKLAAGGGREGEEEVLVTRSTAATFRDGREGERKKRKEKKKNPSSPAASEEKGIFSSFWPT